MEVLDQQVKVPLVLTFLFHSSKMLSRVVLLLLLISAYASAFRSANRVRTRVSLQERKNYSISTKKTLKTGYQPPSQGSGVSKFISGAIDAVKKTVVDAVHGIENAVESVTHPSTEVPMAMAEPITTTVSAPVEEPSPAASLELEVEAEPSPPPAPPGNNLHYSCAHSQYTHHSSLLYNPFLSRYIQHPSSRGGGQGIPSSVKR